MSVKLTFSYSGIFDDSHGFKWARLPLLLLPRINLSIVSFQDLPLQRPLPSQPATTAPLACVSPHLLHITDPAPRALHFTLETERTLFKVNPCLLRPPCCLYMRGALGFMKNDSSELTWTRKHKAGNQNVWAVPFYLCCILRTLSSCTPCFLESTSLPLPTLLGIFCSSLSSPHSAKAGLLLVEVALQLGCWRPCQKNILVAFNLEGDSRIQFSNLCGPLTCLT